jgi:predicted AlkP superfamily phosphohydrolase/phosphomutase
VSRRKRRVLFIGLDAMDPDLISQWASDGVLPAFASLFARGTFGSTHNPPGLYVGAVWPSFFTGVSPARHGRYCYKQIVTGTYAIRRFQPAHLKRPPFWTALSAAGRRVAVVDVPKSPLATDLNGLQLVDWGTHDPDFGSGFKTWPPPLANDIIAKYGSDPVGDCDRIERTTEGYRRFRDNLTSRIERKGALACELFARENWDFFLAVFADSHCVGHQCWTLHDASHPFHDGPTARALGDPVKDVYVSLDRAVGRLLQEADPGSVIVVLASHGMGPHFDATFMLDQILERLEPGPGLWQRGRLKTKTIAQDIRRRAERRLGLSKRASSRTVDHFRCFQIPNNDVYGGIRVNLIGREPRGRIRQGTEYHALFEELRRELLGLVNIDTGQPVVRDLLRSSDLYPDERLDDLPDFLVEWNREAPIERVSSPRVGVIEKRFPGVRNGDHRPEGFFWAVGPDILRGRRVPPVSVMDFAPTVGALLDVALPDLDGKIIEPVAAVQSGAWV